LEKDLKEQPKRWAKLQEQIDQSPGQPHVAPLDDKREPLQMANPADDFVDHDNKGPGASDATVEDDGSDLV
jgi:hypothetical protein